MSQLDPAAGFALHPQLAADCSLVGRFPLCLLLLMNDSNYPWTILVPQRAGVREIYALPEADQHQLLRESSRLGETLMRLHGGDKLNIGALGNMVPQLHVHHIVRRVGDAAWPAPVWGRAPAVPYVAEARAALIAQLQAALPELEPINGTSSNDLRGI